MLTAFVALVATVGAVQGPIPVKVVQSEKRFSLLRGGQPYFVKGVGGDQDLDELLAIGGNSFRTWGAEKLDIQLDLAKELNLTVCAGIWLGHRRHGFKYDDAAAVEAQKQQTLAVVRRYKDHPNLLVWGLGNEVENEGDDPKIYTAINDIAKEVKKLDPNHPTMTVIAEIGDNKIERIRTLCPDIDILGVNSYAGLSSLPQRLRAAGWTKPYIVTEFGPPGPWEVGKTPWGAPLEPSSTEKGDYYAKSYQGGIQNQDQCLGSYAFLWGNKQEGTATWFGMILPTGEKLAPVDALATFFGKPRPNKAPVLKSIDSPVKMTRVKAGKVLEFSAIVTDPEGDPLSYRWVLQREQTERKFGGDPELPPEIVATHFTGTKTTFGPKFTPGGYRVFLYVTDGKGGAAVGNIPFYVE